LSKKKNFLVVFTGDLPHRSVGASTTIFYQYINHLLKKKHNVHLLYFSTKKINSKNEKIFIKSFKFNKIKSFYNYNFKNYYSFNKYNFLIKKIKTNQLNNELINKIKSINPEKILALDITAASFAKQIFNNNIFVWLGDLNFSTTWYHFYYNFKNKVIFYLYFFAAKILVHKWKIFYKEVLENTKNISGSNANIRELKKIGIKSSYQPYPWTKIHKKLNIKKKSIPSFIFFGNLVGLGSKSAMNYLIKNIYPKYQEIWGVNGFKIYICGSYDLEFKLKKKIKSMKNLIFMGYVKNLNSLVSSCHGCLFPIDVPVGNRSRIVTALGSGWPIIAHKHTAIGNPALKNGYNCYLAKNENQFGLFSKMLYKKRKLNDTISKNAIKTYNSTFNPSQSLSKFEKFLNE